MRIAFVAQPNDAVLPPLQNSVGLWSYEAGRRLAGEHEVLVYMRGGRWRRRVSRHSGMAVVELPTAPDTLLQRTAGRLRRGGAIRRPAFAAPLAYLGYAAQVALDLRARRCDIIQIHNYSQLVPTIRALNPRARIVLQMHCEWLTQLDPAWIAPRLGRADMVLASSEYLAGLVRRRFPGMAACTHPIYNGISLDSHAALADGPGAGPPRLLYVGRVSPEKGLHWLVEALPAVAARVPELRLEIVGATSQLAREQLVGLSDDERVRALGRFFAGDSRHSYYDYLRRRLEELGMAGRVSFTGNLPHHEMFAHYRAADLYVQPSFSDTFPFTTVEAMATGLPVVAANVGGLPESVAHGETGLLVEPDDVPGLADALARLLTDAELRRAMGRAGRLRVAELFSWERIVANLRAAYADLAAAPAVSVA